MTRLLHISDLHFGTEQPHVVDALLALSDEKKPDVLVVSGDITQRATQAQFSSAKAFCDRLGIARMLALPGNHDIPLFNPFARLVQPYAAYQQAFGIVLEPELTTPSLCLVTVNTTRWWRHKDGEVSQAQIARVCEQLSRATPQQLRAVVVHQPVHVLRPQDEHDRLHGWQSAVRAWSAAGADIVMGGHIHLPYVCELTSTVSGLSRRLWCVQAGTAVSSRIRREAPNSVNLLEFAPAANGVRCSVERWNYQNAKPASNAGQFALAHTSVLDPQRN
jgi:3',5'-cyclic AMP phosphodiesterase CpdA